ncbi:MAG: hypothetical protein O8C63_09330 [Candidatus Methanoperedens sp.]|nr:hypothetical protein [Candidatus Methanoperedens sp.]
MNIFEPGGTLGISLMKNSFIPGETVKGRVKLVLEKPVKARRFLVSLRGEEWVDVSCGSGKSHRAKKEEINIHSDEIELSGEKVYDFMEKDFEFKIPENAPPTIEGEGAGLQWLVHAKLDIPMGRDKNAMEELLVY